MPDQKTTPAAAGDTAEASTTTTDASCAQVQEDAKTTSPPVEPQPTGEATPDAAAGTDQSKGNASYDQVLRVQEGVDKLLQRFDQKLLHDEARTSEIKRLSAELAKYQPDAQWATARTFIDQMIRHLDEIQQFVRRYEGRDDSASKEFLEALNWLHDNIELALEEHEITAFRPQAGKDPFDGRRHSVAGNPIPTSDAKLSRVIERCVRPGFERGGQVVARASVKTYRHDDTAGQQQQD